MERFQTRRNALIAIAAIAAVAGGAWFTMDERLPETTLEKLFDACASFAETGETNSLAALGVQAQDGGRVEARFDVEGGTVSVELVEILSEGENNQCEVWGARRGDSDAFTNPSLSWRAAKARVDAWFERRAALPGMVKLSVVAVPENHSLVACPSNGQGYTLGGGTTAMSLSPPVAFTEQPMRFTAGRSQQQARMACRMVGQVGKP